MTRPIPFEALHCQEALFMQWVFSKGLAIVGDRICKPRPRGGIAGKYRRVIDWIRTRPDRDL